MRGWRAAQMVVAGLGLVLISPVLVLYGLWVFGGRLADLADQRRARRRRR